MSKDKYFRQKLRRVFNYNFSKANRSANFRPFAAAGGSGGPPNIILYSFEVAVHLQL
jgi:hypothetical protein